MFKQLLRSLAWRILDEEIRKGWIHRTSLGEYTKWMSRDFPVMEDTWEFFKKDHMVILRVFADTVKKCEENILRIKPPSGGFIARSKWNLDSSSKPF